ncbi:MAG TPA: hypothetical protein VMH50_09360 [Thermoleophilia bacterium]|nr:hypothetical protein [Thermoleophilia bacterium]
MLASLTYILAVGGSSRELGSWRSSLEVALVLIVGVFASVFLIGAIARRRD